MYTKYNKHWNVATGHHVFDIQRCMYVGCTCR